MKLMSTNDERLRNLIAQQAADWFVANRAGPSAREREAFAAWLKASPLHVEEYLGVAAVARDLGDACAGLAESTDSLIAFAQAEDDEPTPLTPSIIEAPRDGRPAGAWPAPASPVRARPVFAGSGRRPGRWPIATTGLGALAALGLLLLGWWNFKAAPTAARSAGTAATLHFSTGHGELETQRLPDDSILHLNTDTSVTVLIGAAERQVTLVSGEADFEVAHDPKRPFRVVAGSAQILDVGTRFDVRLDRGFTVITVGEGHVSVGPLKADASSATGPRRGFVELAANQQMRVAEWPPAAPVTVDGNGATSWMRRQITFEHEPLSRVAREFNRYASKPIEIATPALGNLEISGVFATDDTEEFITFLRSLKGVHVEITASRILVTQE
jgi:transmembrane sensor